MPQMMDPDKKVQRDVTGLSPRELAKPLRDAGFEAACTLDAKGVLQVSIVVQSTQAHRQMSAIREHATNILTREFKGFRSIKFHIEPSALSVWRLP